MFQHRQLNVWHWCYSPARLFEPIVQYMPFWILHCMGQFCNDLRNLYITSHQLLQYSLIGSMASWAWLQKNGDAQHIVKVVVAMEQWMNDKKDTEFISATQVKWSCPGQSGELPWAHYGKPKYKHSWGQLTSPWNLMSVIRSIITRPLAWCPWQRIPQGIMGDIKGSLAEKKLYWKVQNKITKKQVIQYCYPKYSQVTRILVHSQESCSKHDVSRRHLDVIIPKSFLCPVSRNIVCS